MWIKNSFKKHKAIHKFSEYMYIYVNMSKCTQKSYRSIHTEQLLLVTLDEWGEQWNGKVWFFYFVSLVLLEFLLPLCYLCNLKKLNNFGNLKKEQKMNKNY